MYPRNRYKLAEIYMKKDQRETHHSGAPPTKKVAEGKNIIIVAGQRHTRAINSEMCDSRVRGNTPRRVCYKRIWRDV